MVEGVHSSELGQNLQTNLLFPLGGVVETRCPENKENLLPALLEAVLEVEPALKLRDTRGGGEILLQQDLPRLLRPLQSRHLGDGSNGRLQVLGEVFLQRKVRDEKRGGRREGLTIGSSKRSYFLSFCLKRKTLVCSRGQEL